MLRVSSHTPRVSTRSVWLAASVGNAATPKLAVVREYQELLKKEGIAVALQGSHGSRDNLKLLKEGKVDIAIGSEEVGMVGSPLMTVEFFSTRVDLVKQFRLQPVWVRWPAYYAVCMAIWLLGISTEAKACIYFQF
mgnify:CR=1 FL=1